jgi:Glycosyl hydrolases family 39
MVCLHLENRHLGKITEGPETHRTQEEREENSFLRSPLRGPLNISDIPLCQPHRKNFVQLRSRLSQLWTAHLPLCSLQGWVLPKYKLSYKIMVRRSTATRLSFMAAIALLLLSPMTATQAAPQTSLVEAEANPPGQVITDSSASGGKYVTSQQAYQPLASAPLPSGVEEPIMVWVRYRGVAVQLKGIAADGSQKELNWLWDRPSTFRWASFGSHSRAELGNKILVIGGPDRLEKAGVDALVLTTDPNFNPYAAAPEPTTPPVDAVSIDVQVDWEKTTGQTTPFMFGTNGAEIAYPEAVADTVFKKRFTDTGIRLVRVHGDLLGKWTNPSTKSWDSAKLKAAYDAFSPNPPTLIQNIPGWPSWMAQDKDGLLAPSEYDRYAAFCAELVEILNLQQKRKIVYWEPLNEQDTRYKKAGKLDELWKIYNKTAKAMKAKDASIRVGGPALTYDDAGTLASFLKASAGNVDFVSWHRYATGDANASNDELMSIASEFGDQVKTFRRITTQYIPSRKVPLLLGEYNINYTWDSGEQRQNSSIGAVWFASVLKSLADAGINMATSWHLKDGIYGMIGPDNDLRPAASVFTWANKYLVGAVVEGTSSQSAVEVMAVRQKDQSRSLLLINKGARPAALTIKTTDKLPWEAATGSFFRLDDKGVRKGSLDALSKAPLTLPGYSLVLLHLS